MFIYLPVEIKNRDFYPRLLLAKHLIEKGHKVIIGRKKEIEIYASRGPKGIYYSLQSTKNYFKFYQKLKSQGHKIALSDEEGLVTYSDKIYLNTRASNQVLNIADVIFLWGTHQYNIYKKHRKKFLQKFCVVGNPRFDLNQKILNNFFLKKTKIKYNEYVLINSSFAISNHFDESKNSIKFRKKIGLISNKFEEKGFLYLRNYNKVKLKKYIELANFLASKIKIKKVIFKIHPSESMNIYRKLLNKKVIIIKDANITDCILKSEYVIHDYCTTSLEGLLYKKIPICYKVTKNDLYLNQLPYYFSNSFEEKEDILSFINSKKKKFLKKKNINLYIDNFSQKKSCKKI